MADETPGAETPDPDECKVGDPLHDKLGFVTHALAGVLGISPTIIQGSCENDGEVTLPLSAAEVLLWRFDWLTVAAHGVSHAHRGVNATTVRYIEGRAPSPPPDGPWPPDGTAPLQGPFFP